jgi:hypothetical protein
MPKTTTQKPDADSKPKDGKPVNKAPTYKSGQVVPKSGVYTISGGDGSIQGKALCLSGESFYGTKEGDPPLNFSLDAAVPHQKDMGGLTPVIWG